MKFVAYSAIPIFFSTLLSNKLFCIMGNIFVILLKFNISNRGINLR